MSEYNIDIADMQYEQAYNYVQLSVRKAMRLPATAQNCLRNTTSLDLSLTAMTFFI